MMELLFLTVGVVELIIVLPLLAFMFYSLFHAATNMGIPALHRLIWGLVILLLPILGSIVYWMVGRKPVRKPIK